MFPRSGLKRLCPKACATSTNGRALSPFLLNVDRGDAERWKRDGQRRSTRSHRAYGNRRNRRLSRGRGCRHLIEISCAGQRCPVIAVTCEDVERLITTKTIRPGFELS